MSEHQIAEVQVHPAPRCCHNVKFYEHDRELIDGLERHIGDALECGDIAIVIATKPHRELLAEIRGIAEQPTLAELRERLHQRKPVAAKLDTARLVRKERDVSMIVLA